MKKIFFLLAAMMCYIGAWAASITAPTVDFGTVSIKGQTLPVTGSQDVTVSFSGFSNNDQDIYAEVTEGLLDDATNPNGFYVSPTYVYKGYEVPSGTCEFTVHYSVKAAGTYTGKIHFFSDYSVEGYANITITVVDDAIVAKTTPFERINSTSELQAGDTVIFVSESAGAAGGALFQTYLPAVTENVKINASTGKADIPDDVQTFVLSQYSGNWQFTKTGTTDRLLLDITGKGAFAYGTPVANQLLAGWGIEISGGVAEVGKPDGTFPVEFNSDRFKPYKNAGSGTSIALYKKAGAAQEVQSSLVIDPTTIDFGNVGRSAEKEITISYTGEHIEDDIIWLIQGTDAGEFELTEGAYNTRTSGSLTIKYLGNATKSSLVAELAFLTLNAQLDAMEGAFPINISLVDFNGISFKQSNYGLLKNESKDMSAEIVFDPADVADKSLTWKFDKTYYFATLSDAGVFQATATGDYVLIATSALDETKQAKCTVTVSLPVPTAIELSDTEHTMHIDETWTLTATVKPDGTEKKALFESSNTAVATVNKNGVITAKTIGTAIITVSAESYPDVKSTCTINVIKRTVESISLPAEADVTLGSSLQLNPVVTPSEAASEYTISYESGNTAVATVDENGKVKAVAVGDAVITATISDQSAQITIHVVAAATFAKVTDASDIAAKDTIILATIYEGNGVIAGAHSGKKLTVLTEGVTVTETEAYADDALRLVVGTLKNKTGFSLQPVGSTKVLAENGNDVTLENTTSTKNLTWKFMADGSNGVYVQSVGNSNAYFKYLASSAAIKPYKAGSVGAVYVYVYIRKFRNPEGIEDVQDGVSAQKVLRDGQLLIIRNGETFNANGVKVE